MYVEALASLLQGSGALPRAGCPATRWRARDSNNLIRVCRQVHATALPGSHTFPHAGTAFEQVDMNLKACALQRVARQQCFATCWRAPAFENLREFEVTSAPARCKAAALRHALAHLSRIGLASFNNALRLRFQVVFCTVAGCALPPHCPIGFASSCVFCRVF